MSLIFNLLDCTLLLEMVLSILSLCCRIAVFKHPVFGALLSDFSSVGPMKGAVF